MGPPKGHLGRAMLLCAIVLVARVAPLGAAVNKPVLIEGFEKSSAAKSNEAVKPVTSGPGLTQGASAAELTPGGAIAVKVRGADITRLPWLRIDTHHTGEGPRGLEIHLASGKTNRSVQGYVRTGADTLAFPLSLAIAPAGKKPDKRVFTIGIKNSGDISIVVDNLRLEPTVRQPRGAVFWDFGGTRSKVWPGFTRKGPKSNDLKWKGRSSYPAAHDLPYPDPLTRDFIGPYHSNLGNNQKVHVTISAPTPKSMAAWLWLTHYGRRYSQPQEYMCRPAAGRRVGKKLTPGQLVGPDGLLEGEGGPWTPKWCAGDYADHFVTLMPFSMIKGKAVLEFGNCQPAAMAMAPTAGRSAMTACIKQIQNELVRFRRQFVMKDLNRNICRLKPTGAEKKLGLMLFRVPPDEAFTGAWKPRADQRAWAIHEIARPGGTIRVPLAFVPLKRKSVVFSVIPGSLRSDSGSALPVNRKSFQIDYLQLVSEVRGGVAVRRPWLLAAKSPAVAVGEIGYVWLTAAIPPKAREGLYRGTWKLGSGSARISLPVEIEIVGSTTRDAGDVKDLAIVSYELPAASSVYASAALALPIAKQQKLGSEVFKQVGATGINAYVFSAVRASRSGSGGPLYLYSSSLSAALEKFPFKDLKGVMFLDIRHAMDTLGWGAAGNKRGLLGDAISQTNALTDKHSVGRRYFYFGYTTKLADDKRASGLSTRLAGAKRFASEGSRVAIGSRSSVLAKLSAADFTTKLGPVSALVLEPDSSALASQIEAFKKLNGPREVYLHISRADRLTMGFYAASVRADGCFVSRVFMTGGPYNGYYIDGHGLVAPRSGGKLAQTVSAFRMKQARDDWRLVFQARAILDQAASANLTAREISDVLAEIKARVGSLEKLTYDTRQFATTAVSQAEMDSWRASLLNAIGIVKRRLAGVKRQ